MITENKDGSTDCSTVEEGVDYLNNMVDKKELELVSKKDLPEWDHTDERRRLEYESKGVISEKILPEWDHTDEISILEFENRMLKQKIEQDGTPEWNTKIEQFKIDNESRNKIVIQKLPAELGFIISYDKFDGTYTGYCKWTTSVRFADIDCYKVREFMVDGITLLLKLRHNIVPPEGSEFDIVQTNC